MSGHPYPHTDREVLRHVERAGGRAGYKQLVRELGMGGGRERRMLLEQLTKMTARGALAKLDRDTWALPEIRKQRAANETGRRGFASAMRERNSRENLIAGKLSLHRDGFGFVRPPEGEDLFIPPHEINGAMQGDEVLVDAEPPKRDGRRSGRIVRVLTRRNPTVVGIFHAAGSRGRGPARNDAGYRGEEIRMRGSFVTPLDERMTQPVLILDDHDLPGAAINPHRTLGEDAAHVPHRWDGSLEDLNGLAVDVEITHYPADGSPARGRVVEVLGDPDDFGVDVEIIIRKHHLPHVFPADVLAEAQDAARWNVASLDAAELAARRDFRGEPIVTIDGETAKDFDDAVLVRPLPDGTFELQVHIADVAEYVRDNTALDLEARLRGNSVYFPDRAIPMLPQELSNGECSLRPDEDRLVLSCVIRIDADGHVLGFEICEGILRSARRMTYTDVQRILDGDATARAEFAPLVPEFERMYDLALRLNRKRVRRGSIDFDLPEPVIEFDDLGRMRGVVRSERAWANRLIEEFMLCANECVARWIEASGVPGIYRIHELPDPKRIVDFEEAAASFGYTLGAGALPVRTFTMKADRRETQRRSAQSRDTRRPKGHEVVDTVAVTPQMYQRLTAKIAGKPEERILSYLMLRSLKQARYAEPNEGHFALAAPAYTHFTSPIRRYPDLIVHRILKTLLHEGASPFGDAEPGEPAAESSQRHRGTRDAAAKANGPVKTAAVPAFDEPYPREELVAIAQETSETERRAADAERELIEWKKIKFMGDRIGEDFDAMVLSVTKYGFFVELRELYVEGLVPIFTLTGDHYTYREGAREICGQRGGRCYRPGMQVRVLLDRIDRENRRLQFALLPEEPENATVAPPGTRLFKSRKTKATSAKSSGTAAPAQAKAAKRGKASRFTAAAPTTPAGASPDRSGKPRRKSGKGKNKGKRR